MSWQHDLLGKTVFVLSAGVSGVVSQVHEEGSFIREGAAPGELPIPKPVIQLVSGHAFLAGDDDQSNFREMDAREQFILESAQEAIKNSISQSFRVGIAAQLDAELTLMYIIASLDEAQRSLMAPPVPESAPDASAVPATETTDAHS